VPASSILFADPLITTYGSVEDLLNANPGFMAIIEDFNDDNASNTLDVSLRVFLALMATKPSDRQLCLKSGTPPAYLFGVSLDWDIHMLQHRSM